MILTPARATRFVFFAAAAFASAIGGCSSSEAESREPSSDLTMPRREAKTETAEAAQGNAPGGPQSVTTFAPPANAQCKVADDCTGPLPDIACLQCWDGSDTCARHTCVGGKCDVAFPTCPPQCATDADCRTFSDGCGGCNCRALGAKQPDPKCAGAFAACFADPCATKVAACDVGSHLCIVK
jgi:hypothetical protein